MDILTNAIVSIAEMENNYKSCRNKADGVGKLFIMDNNQPDAVLFSIAEYEKYSAVIEYLERSEVKGIEKVIGSLPKVGNRRACSVENMKNDVK